ncbi:Anaphase-promoting complex subunit 1 [Phytophthora cactorum]|nr:Anaphase-promoting complex subunit 1 [Phytophthora cactorum]
MAEPSIRMRCAGVRDNQHRSLPTDSGRVFFSESQYSSSPFLVRVTFDSVSFVHRGTQIVERRFVFPGRVLHAVLTDFSPQVLNTTTTQTNGSTRGRRARKSSLKPQLHPHLCVLVRSDCLNVYTAAGEVFEVALPFQANKLFPMEGRGLLLQRSPAAPIPLSSAKRPRDVAAVALARKNRRASTSNRGDGNKYRYSSGDKTAPVRPRYFTLRHPLDEVKPVALSGKSGEKFLSDSALEAVDVLEAGVSPVLVAFHRWEQRFCVFRMHEVQKSTGGLIPEVRVVDGPTWTRFRTRSDLEELRVRIEPDWMATMLWKTPRVGPANSKSMFLSPIASSPSLLTASPVTPLPLATNASSTSSGNATKVSFIASNVDGLPLLCIMDKASGTFLMKPLSMQENATAAPDDGDNGIGSVRILQCRDAVPIRQFNHEKSSENGEDQGFASSTDIVVLEKDGTLVLYKAHYPICRLVLPDVEQSDIGALNTGGSERMRLIANVQLNSIGKGEAYEIVYPDLCGNCSGKIWRCEHPLKIVSSPLLQQVFNVLGYIVPSTELGAFKAYVVCRTQEKTQNSAQADDFADGGFEWESFCESIIGLLQKQTVDKDEVLASVSTAGANDDEEMAAAPSSSAFDALCQSEFHDIYQYEHAMLFATMELPVTESSSSGDRATSLDGVQMNGKISHMGEYVGVIFAGLHLLCEDLKLSITLFKDRLHLAELLLKIADRLKLKPFVAYYKDDNCVLQHRTVPTEKRWGLELHPKTDDGGLLGFTTYGSVPDLILWLQDKMTAKPHTSVDFPSLENAVQSSGSSSRRPDNPLRRTRAICRVYEIIFSSPEERVPHLLSTQSNAFKLIVYLTQDPIGSALSLDDLPVGLGFPIVQTIRQVKHHPPPFITEDIFAFHDPASKAGDSSSQAEDELRDDCDGLEDIISRSQPLFPTDQRVKEVARLLRSSRPLCLKLEKTPDLSDLDYAQQQQARLLLLCKRSMALSVARGMVTLGSFDGSTAQTQIWRLHIPALPLQGRKPPANAIVELDLSGYAKELTYWPQFHNGCATGLRLPAHDLSGLINRHWIKYHRPSVNDTQRNSNETRQAAAIPPADTTGRNLEEAYAAHAGLLLGIGLRGHLKCLSMADVYNYLSLSNEFVTVAIMLVSGRERSGSCLYRGRRWHSFGSGGNGFNSAVNGSTTGNGTPNNTGASPGAGRDTKHSSDRSGARSGGEHVNIGVTACASALALAFMYMQTNNKAVAAQLAVPDTLILLDYVRPDILLTRGGDVRGDTDYFSGSPSHSDLHSICEAYANIIAGACMSIGLRFAGTGNTSARVTLRNCDRACTVERCLAVCAQALALVDAGTGHVETLTLLRSITLRQRVDAAMSYGNHMALSMAIGLLFLGGGRATVSRSKEAIAALVISLYPMPPMNTADNKYHLQAFRHLYVLAVDNSRLLETVDVNTKRTCAVQVRVDLLPDITSIERLVISDPEFYPIEILTPQSDERVSLENSNMRTANSLRLELLRSKNVVFLKRRHRKDFGVFADFTAELEQPHDRHGNRSGDSDDNRVRRLFRAYFTSGISGDDDCEDAEDEANQLDVADWGSSWWATQLSPRTLEQVRDEEQLLMPAYLNALHALFRLQQVPQLASAIEVVDLNLFSEYCRLQVNGSGGITEKRSAFSEFGVWLSNQTEEALSALWHRTSLDITSLASARVQLLVEAAPSTSQDGLTEAENTFWLKLVSFFLFSN